MSSKAGALAACLLLAATLIGVVLLAALGAGSASAAPTCTIFWTGTTGSAWSTATNWSLTNGGASAGRAPTATDYVCMSTSPAHQAATVTTTTVGGINWPQSGSVKPSLAVAGTLTVGTKTTAFPSTIDQLSSIGTLAGKATLTVPTGGDLTLTSGNLSGGIHLINQGTGTSSGEVLFTNASVLENGGTLNLTDNSELYANDNTADLLQNDASGTVSYGSSSASGGVTLSVTTSNAGLVSVTKGTLSIQTLTNLVAGTLTGGTYSATGGTLAVPAAITTNAAIIKLGAGGAINVGSTNALSGLTTNSGSLLLGRSLVISKAVANSGIITVTVGTLQVNTLTQSKGTTTVVSGAILKAGTTGVTINGGLLTGTGQVAGVVSNKGTVDPTGGAGPLTVTSTDSQASPGVLLIPISGSTNVGTDFGQLNVNGAATLGGTLTVSSAPGYVPALGTTFTIVKASSISGTFASVTGNLLSDRGYAVSYTPTTVVLTVVLPPTVTSIAPTDGPLAGGTAVTVTGTNLTGTTVSFGTAAATVVSVSSDGTSLTATSPAGSGTVDVTATNSGLSSGTTAADQFTYVPPPVVTSISPTAGPLAGGTVVQITGTNLANSTVNFGSTPATDIKINPAGTAITATAPAGTGTLDVQATTVGGTSATSAADQFAYLGPPSISSISPTAGPLGGGTVVTVSGTNLTQATVAFGTKPASTVTVNGTGTSLTATAPAGSAGTVDVQVVTPGGTSPASSADQFTYVRAPTVKTVSPSAGPLVGGKVITIAGTNLANAAVAFGANPATKVTIATGGSSLTATSPAGAAGVVDVRVTTPGGRSAIVAADHFTYVPAPTISGVSPTNGPLAGGTLVTVTGTNLTGTTAVSFGSTHASAITVNPAGTSLTATSPTGTGTVDVKVTTAGGTSAASAADHFTYLGTPNVTQISPASGANGGGTVVSVTGTNLAGATSVSFGPNAATAVTVNEAGTSLTATSPAGTGAVDVLVTNPLATSAATPADQFTYLPVLSIGNVSQPEGNSGTTPMTFTVTLSATSPVPASINYQTVDGTAKAGSDYTATSGTLNIPVGQTSGTVSVPIIGDTVPENDETFLVQLMSATGATGAPASATGTIQNDDPAPVLRTPTSFSVAAPASGTKIHTYSLSTLCSASVANFPCVQTSSDPPSAFSTWTLTGQNFGTTDLKLKWGPAGGLPLGEFSITIDKSMIGKTPPQLTYTATDGTGVSNTVTLTITIT